MPTSGGVTTTNVGGGANNILGDYATVGGTTWATSGAGIGPFTIGALASGSYVADYSTSTTNSDFDATTGGTFTATNSVDSFRFNNPAAVTATLNGAFVVGSGGILETANVGANAAAFSGGTSLTSGNGTDLTVIQNNTAAGLTIATPIVNNGSAVIGFNKDGPGAVTLAGANTYTGITNINASSLILTGLNTTSGAYDVNIGSLQVGAIGGATGALGTSNVVLASGASLVFNRTDTAYSYSGVISGAGAVVQNGAGSTTLNTANTFTGGLTINAGSLISHTGGGTTSLGIGPVTVNAAGTLVGGAADSFGYGATNAPSLITVNGGTITDLAGAYRVTMPSITFNGGGVLTNVAGNTGDANGNYSFFGNGAETITVTNPGATTATISATNVWVQSSTVLNVAAGSANSQLLIDANLISSGNSITVEGAGVTTFAGTNTFTGPVTINGGSTLQIGNNGATGTISVGGTVADSGTLAFNRGDNALLVSNVISGAGAVSQISSGAATLTGANTYTGATSVTAGTLYVDGSLGSASSFTANNFTVAAGAGLGGDGSIYLASGKNVVIAGTLSPGFGAEGAGASLAQALTLTATSATNNAITFSSGSTLALDLSHATSQAVTSTADYLNVPTGTVVLGTNFASLSLTQDGTVLVGDKFTIIDPSNLTGAFAGGLTGTSNGIGYSLQYNQGASGYNVVLTVTAVPEPGAFALAGLGLTGLVAWWALRRRAGAACS